jgi:hypothetical protein
MKPVLDWTKSKAEAASRRAARTRGWRHAASSPFLLAEGALVRSVRLDPLAHPEQGPCPVDVSELFLQLPGLFVLGAKDTFYTHLG